MFRADHEFVLPRDFLEKHGLNPDYQYAKLEHVRMLLNFQEKSLFKIAPQLTEECINPSHFKVWNEVYLITLKKKTIKISGLVPKKLFKKK